MDEGEGGKPKGSMKEEKGGSTGMQCENKKPPSESGDYV